MKYIDLDLVIDEINANTVNMGTESVLDKSATHTCTLKPQGTQEYEG